MPWMIAIFRLYLRTLERISPRLAGRQAYRLFSRPRLRRPVPKAVQKVMAQAELLTLQVDGKRVAAYRWPATSGDAAPRVFLVHGWESRAARLAVWVEPLLAAGFEVASFDAPAHGDSEGSHADPVRFVRAIHALAERVGSPQAFVSHSLGAFSTVLACAAGELLDRENQVPDRMVFLAGAESGVDAMTMFCEVLGLGTGFASLLIAAAGEEGGHPVPSFDVHRRLATRPIPTLWLHDPADLEVPYSGAQKVADACPHVILQDAPGLGHHNIARDPSTLRRGLAFLQTGT